MDCREQVAMVQPIVYGLGISLLSHPRTQWGISCTVDQTTVTCSQVQITFTLKLNSSHLLQQAMYLLCFALFATSILTECVSQETSGVGFSQPVLPEVKDSLRENPDKYNEWTSEVVRIIHATGGKNANES